MFENNDYELWCGDCLDLMAQIPEHSIDMIFTDLPYGTTRCKWDSPIRFEPLWEHYNRIIKDHGAILLFGTQPFTSALVMSNLKMFRYEWIYEKAHPTGHLNAKKQPMRSHENILVFYKKPPTYNPQMTHGHKRKIAHRVYTREDDGNSCYGREVTDRYYDSTDRYPWDIVRFNNSNQTAKIHRTQKPVDLAEYFIKTYTNEGEIVLDSCAGSMTTAIAALNTKRKVICIEKDETIFEKGKQRVLEHVKNMCNCNNDCNKKG